MKTLSYHGTLDETHLKRLNVTLHGIAQNEWNIVKNYSRQYNLAWNSYMKGASEYLESASDASSNYNAKTSEIQALVQVMINQDSSTIAAVQEAQQEASDARTEAQQEAQNTGISAEDLAEVNEMYQDILKGEAEAAQAAQEAATNAAIANEAYEQASENWGNYYDTEQIAIGGGVGTGTYTNAETGQEQTFTRGSDGTTTLTGVTASDGTVGTVTQNPDGTLTFTTEDGQTMEWHGGTPSDIVGNAGNAISQDLENKQNALGEANKAAEEAKAVEEIEKANADSAALDLEDQNRENAAKDDPDTTNGNDDWGEWGDFVNGD